METTLNTILAELDQRLLEQSETWFIPPYGLVVQAIERHPDHEESLIDYRKAKLGSFCEIWGYGLVFSADKLTVDSAGFLLPCGAFVSFSACGHGKAIERLLRSGALMEGELVIHVTHGMWKPFYRVAPTPEQLRFMYATDWKAYEHAGDYMKSAAANLGKGGKYGSLYVMRALGIPVPEFTLVRPKNLFGFCMRTSPKHSAPGVLTSRFDVTDDTHDGVLKEMLAEFEASPENGNNELTVFYQKIIHGLIGVAHYKNGKVHYLASHVRGQVVGGESSDDRLSAQNERLLESWCIKLSKGSKYWKLLQLEFAQDETGKLWALQARKFHAGANEFEHVSKAPDTATVVGEVFCLGKFSHGKITSAEIEMHEIGAEVKTYAQTTKLVVLVGYSEFSHAAALAASRKITCLLVKNPVELDDRAYLFEGRHGTNGWLVLERH